MPDTSAERVAEIRELCIAQMLIGEHVTLTNEQMDDLLAALDAARDTLGKAKGYMLNAKIDLETGTPKSTAIQTLDGGLRMIEAALARQPGGGEGEEKRGDLRENT